MALLTSCGGDPEGHPRARPARVVRGRLEAAWHVGQVSVMSPSLFYLSARRRRKIRTCHVSYESELLLSLSAILFRCMYVSLALDCLWLLAQ